MSKRLQEHLSGLNSDVLKGWLKEMDALEKGQTRKDDFIRGIATQLTRNLPSVLARLALAEKCLLAECAHTGRFVSAREFEAKYETRCPLPAMVYNWKQKVSLLTPFIHLPHFRNWDEACLVADLEEPLRQLLPPPKGVAVRHVTRIPKAWPSEHQSPSNDPIRTIHTYEGERVATVELARVLRLVQAGKVQVTDSARRPTDATVRLINESLVVPDFDVEVPENARSDWDRRHYTTAGPVRAHSWPVLLQQCGWARSQSGTLTLTSDGRSILGDFSPAKVRDGLSRFLANDDFDELNRIHHIKGQSGKGRRSISQPSQRKSIVAGALKSCPPVNGLPFPRSADLPIPSERIGMF